MFERLLKEIPHEVIAVPAKTILLEAGKTAAKLYVVRSGCIRQWYNANGKDVTCQFFFKDSPVACIESFIHSIPSEYTLETVLPSEICVINGQDVYEWLQYYPDMMADVLKFVLERMLSYSKLFLSRIKETPAECYESLVREHPEIVGQIPQYYIASYLGISPVSLSRIRNRR